MDYQKDILYLDIETAPMEGLVKGNDETFGHLWEEKVEKMKKYAPQDYPDDMSEEDKVQTAGLYAEFGRVVCISFGAFYESKDTHETRFCVSSIYGTDEKQMLQQFANLLDKNKLTYRKLCGHNAKDFDIPYLIRRMLIYQIKLPQILQLTDKKPWETPIVDTMELWKCGATRYSAQLKLLCAVFGIPTPKDDIDGSEVANVFYHEKDYKRISVYCEKDVVATMQVHLHLLGYNSLPENSIVHVGTNPIQSATDKQ